MSVIELRGIILNTFFNFMKVSKSNKILINYLSFSKLIQCENVDLLKDVINGLIEDEYVKIIKFNDYTFVLSLS